MALESATYINSLNVAWPDGAVDPKSDGDNHIRLLKSSIKNTFPNLTGAMNATHTNLNSLVGISASVTSTQLNFLTGLTTNVQVAIDSKANLAGATFTGAIHARTASSDSPLITSHNQTFGGVGLFASGVDGGALLIQTTTAGAYEKRIMTATRNAGQVFYYNDTPIVDFGFFGVTVTGSVSASLVLAAGSYITAGTTITAGTGITSTTGNITATAGNVSDSRGQLKGYRTGVYQALSGSGTTFTGIPSDATMIKIVFANASFTANGQDMGVLVNTATAFYGRAVAIDVGGFTNRVAWNGAGPAVLTKTMASSENMGGTITLTKIDGTSWLCEAITGPWGSTDGPFTTSVGSIVVSAAPSTITIGSLLGTGTYDGGAATMYIHR